MYVIFKDRANQAGFRQALFEEYISILNFHQKERTQIFCYEWSITRVTNS